MTERPTGTVTFLFSDIEGSTRLLEQLRERYDTVLSRHAELFRSAIEQFDGHEIDTQGDAFFVAFARARDAVAAAVAVQRALAAEPWPDGASLRVRIGIHTGEPLVGGERYVGMGVHRGARICAAGHGGQVLLSNTTRELVEDELPEDVHLVDLGEHELKDLKRPERIFQLEIDGLEASFPPLRTATTSAFEGREGELERAAEEVAGRRITKRRAALVAGPGIAVIAAAVLIPLLLLGGSSDTAVAANSVVPIDASGSVGTAVPVGARPVAITSGAGGLWVANLDDESVTRVDASSRQAVRTIPIGDAPTALAATKSAVWVAGGNGGLSKIDPRYDRVASKRSLAPGFFGGSVQPTLSAFGSLWVADPDGVVVRIDPVSGRKLGSVGVGNDPSAIAAGAGSVWVTNSSDGTVTRIDPATLVPTTIPVGHRPVAIAVNPAGAWIANEGDNTVVRVDTGTNAVAGTTPVGEGPTAVVATPTALWVANGGDGTVMRLDPQSGTMSKTIHLGGTPTALATAGEDVWVAVAPAPPHQAEAGGAAHVTTRNGVTSLDPALPFGAPAQVFYATCANLVTLPDRPAPEGSRIVPEVAEAVPAPTAGGTTYTFRIRSGFRFSPPSNEAVTATTFKSTIERVASPRLKSPAASQFSGIVGYQDYVNGKSRHLSGIVARGRTLTVRLARPDGSFLANLATGSACAVPRNTPADPGGLDDIPSAGPYYVASYTPRQQLVLRRNPNYHGDRPRRLDQIVVSFGVDPAQALQQIEAGTTDNALDGIPSDAGPRLEAEYGSSSKAAKQGHQRYFVSPVLGARYLHMNTSRPLFSQARLRRAVNYAIDRPALVAQNLRFANGSPFFAGAPSADYIPASMAGARSFHLYPVKGPDLRRAKRIAGRVHATAIMYTPNIAPWVQEAQIVRRDLAPLGIDVQVKEFAIGDYFARVTRRGEPFDLAVSGYLSSADPVGGILSIFGSSSIGQGNISNFDDPAFDRKLRAVDKLSGASRNRAASRLALELERDDAPAAGIGTNASRDFFSARIGCQVYQPVFGIDLAALCLRK